MLKVKIEKWNEGGGGVETSEFDATEVRLTEGFLVYGKFVDAQEEFPPHREFKISGGLPLVLIRSFTLS